MVAVRASFTNEATVSKVTTARWRILTQEMVNDQVEKSQLRTYKLNKPHVPPDAPGPRKSVKLTPKVTAELLHLGRESEREAEMTRRWEKRFSDHDDENEYERRVEMDQGPYGAHELGYSSLHQWQQEQSSAAASSGDYPASQFPTFPWNSRDEPGETKGRGRARYPARYESKRAPPASKR